MLPKSARQTIILTAEAHGAVFALPEEDPKLLDTIDSPLSAPAVMLSPRAANSSGKEREDVRNLFVV
jgi:hypothetical protein